MSEPYRRLRECVDNWPGCYDGGYDPSCCRFPKSCSCEVYDPETIAEVALEPCVPAPVQAGDKVRLILDGKTWVGIYPDGPWEEEL